jgi:hypothetical protein
MPNGDIEWQWNKEGEGVSYQLVILDIDRNELIRIDAGQNTSINIDPESIPGSGEADASYLWRILAIQDGDEIASSGTRSLSLYE